MRLLDASWRARVAAALLLAFFFRISDAEGAWSTTIPTVIAVLAIGSAVMALLIERRRAEHRL